MKLASIYSVFNQKYTLPVNHGDRTTLAIETNEHIKESTHTTA